MIRLWDMQLSLDNWWISLGFHIDHTDPSITIHLPIIIICIGKPKQPGFKYSFRRWLFMFDIREKLLKRLHNWKFNSALEYLEVLPEPEKSIVRKLAEEYGNIGWVTGKYDFKDNIEAELQKIDGYETPSLFGMKV